MVKQNVNNGQAEKEGERKERNRNTKSKVRSKAKHKKKGKTNVSSSQITLLKRLRNKQMKRQKSQNKCLRMEQGKMQKQKKNYDVR